MKINISKVFKGAGGLAHAIFDYVTAGVGNIRSFFQNEVDTTLLDIVTDIILPAIRQKLVENESVFTRTLYDSLYFTQVRPGLVVLNTSVDINYAMILERGSPPRALDPWEPELLVKWVIHKTGNPESISRLIAAAVALKIQNVGNTPHPFIQPALDETLEIAKEQFGRDFSLKLGLK